jgi:hypothetical protein
MNNDIEVLYTAEATVTGGREGHGRTSDGRLDVDFDVPSEMGGTGGPAPTRSSSSRPASPLASSRRCCGTPSGASST